jgi:virginiamycin B lyase
MTMLWVKRFLAALLLSMPLAAPTYAAGPPFQLPTSSAFPAALITGSDRNLWFAESGKIGRISTTGSLSEFTLTSGRSAKSLAFGPSGNLWFTEPASGRVGEMTPAGRLVHDEYLLPGNTGYGTPINRPQSVVSAPDGHLWITQTVFSRQLLRTVGSKIDRIDGVNADGTLALTQFSLPSGNTKSTTPALDALVVGLDGALWFTDTQQGRVWRKTTASDNPTFISLPHGSPAGIAAGPDGAIWVTASFSGPQGNQLVRIIADRQPQEFSVPADGQNGATLGRIASAGVYLWFAAYDMTTSAGRVFRSTTAGALTRLPFPTYMEIDGLTAGPDGALWFGRTDNQTGTGFIDRIAAG